MLCKSFLKYCFMNTVYTFKNMSLYNLFCKYYHICQTFQTLCKVFYCTVWKSVCYMRPIERENYRRYKTVRQKVVVVSVKVSFAVLVVEIDFVFFVSTQCNIYFLILLL